MLAPTVWMALVAAALLVASPLVMVPTLNSAARGYAVAFVFLELLPLLAFASDAPVSIAGIPRLEPLLLAGFAVGWVVGIRTPRRAVLARKNGSLAEILLVSSLAGVVLTRAAPPPFSPLASAIAIVVFLWDFDSGAQRAGLQSMGVARHLMAGALLTGGLATAAAGGNNLLLQALCAAALAGVILTSAISIDRNAADNRVWPLLAGSAVGAAVFSFV